MRLYDLFALFKDIPKKKFYNGKNYTKNDRFYYAVNHCPGVW